MSYEQWKQIRDNVISDCEVTLEAVRFQQLVPGTSFSYAQEYNSMLFEDFREIGIFIDRQGLWPNLKASLVEQNWQEVKIGRNPFNTVLAGINARYGAISLLIKKLDRLFSGEERFVDKTNHALALLNRKLFMLEDFRARWLSAFDEGTEPKLEKLGGLHLFECGIWAFKAKGPKEETDLILDQRIDEASDRSPLVMTEWKKALDKEDADNKIKQAQNQCEIYGDGIASPLRVNDHRFIVVVSKSPLQIETEYDVQGKRYFVRNIAIDRASPSVQAAKNART